MRATVLATLAASACGLAMASPAAARDGPSFDCGAAWTRTERAICAEPALSAIDAVSSDAFRRAGGASDRKALDVAVREHRGQEACAGDAACILEEQITAIRAYAGLGSGVAIPPWVPGRRLALLDPRGLRPGPTPGRVGQCTRTTITEMSGRLGGPIRPTDADGNDTGMYLRYADGNTQFTYGYDPDAAASHVGDPVATCLASVPKGCPPGDGRGRAYAVTNLRTGGHWTMIDSPHVCGGA